MPSPTLLLTSFTTWKAEQRSNASDDLVADIYHRYPHRHAIHLLRQLPVDFQQAPDRVIQSIQTLAPNAIVCCGMGEKRSHLCIEDRAVRDHQTCYTNVDVDGLGAGLSITRLSQDAGQFVCNHLYFEVLSYLQSHGSHCPCIFIHVPVLTDENRQAIEADFHIILRRMHLLAKRSIHRPMYPIPLSKPLPA